ncbi:MAG TPA: sigma-70 family RNA polymerase sigma factor [Chitinophagaceae bacterium]|nr:sigma-70 family RNA polymerase sigma factor [Chitinophagaceae bacterium]
MHFLKNISSAETDKSLIEQYKASGNLNDLGELYQRYVDLVYGVCLKYLKEPEDAKDCVLNIFEELVTKLMKHEVENFKAWLYQVTRNHCLMKLRKQKTVPVNIDLTFVQSEENLHLDGELEKEENFKQLQYCLEQLNDQQRQVIELFYLNNKCYQEIVDITAIEINKVRSYIQNGRRNLKICMETLRQDEKINK